MTTNSTRTTVYSGPDDWPQWSIDFRRRRDNLGLSDYLKAKDPTPWPTEPVHPDYPEELLMRPTESDPANEATDSSTPSTNTAGNTPNPPLAGGTARPGTRSSGQDRITTSAPAPTQKSTKAN